MTIHVKRNFNERPGGQFSAGPFVICVVGYQSALPLNRPLKATSERGALAGHFPFCQIVRKNSLVGQCADGNCGLHLISIRNIKLFHDLVFKYACHAMGVVTEQMRLHGE